MELDGRVAVVTGGSSGIGAATVASLAAEGAAVYSLDVEPPPWSHRSAVHVSCDVTELEQVTAAVDAVMAERGRIDIVVACAGVTAIGSVGDVELEVFERCLDVNVRGVFYTLRATLPILETQRRGVVTLIGSDQALVGKRRSAAYAATKGAVAQLAKSTALDCAPFDVRVNCVCPGAVETAAFDTGVADFADRYVGENEGVLRRAVTSKVPLRRLGRPDEVAALVRFLSSDEAAYITGALMSIDGGYVAQ